MMKRFPSCRWLVAATLVACVSRPVFAEIVPTAARRDTTIPCTGRWRDELPAMLARIASTLDSGFAARERKIVLEELGAIRPRVPHDRYTRIGTRSYIVQVRFRGRASVFNMYAYWPDTSRVSFYVRSPDTLLLDAIDSTFRAARRALLSAPKGVLLHLEEASVWNGSTPAMDVLLDVAPAVHCPHFGLETQSESRGDTVAIHIDGAAPRDSCPQDYWPTGMGHRRPVTPGRYHVAMDYESDTNRFVIDVTDSSLALSTIRSTFVTADERIRWRVPSGSVVLTCSRLAAGRDSICKELQSWATRHVGLQRVVFDTASGVSPLRYNAGAYRYDDRALANLRGCVSTIHPVMRKDWAIALEIRPRTRPWMVDRVFNPSDVPRVATDPSCGLPPSIADYGKKTLTAYPLNCPTPTALTRERVVEVFLRRPDTQQWFREHDVPQQTAQSLDPLSGPGDAARCRQIDSASRRHPVGVFRAGRYFIATTINERKTDSTIEIDEMALLVWVLDSAGHIVHVPGHSLE